MDVREPNRVRRTRSHVIAAPVEEVFPLYCPVREVDWVAGWSPLSVWSRSGLVEADCVFETEAGGDRSIWVVTRHDPEALRVEMWKITPEVTACKLEIALERLAAGGAKTGRDERGGTAPGTRVTVAYSHTSLGPRGDALVADFTEEAFGAFMDRWEAAMAHWFRTGECLK